MAIEDWENEGGAQERHQLSELRAQEAQRDIAWQQLSDERDRLQVELESAHRALRAISGAARGISRLADSLDPSVLE
jgi:hypothetical protein